MEILTDQTIDESTARYFCIFADKDLLKSLNAMGDERQVTSAVEQLMKAQSKQLNEEQKDMNVFNTMFSKAKGSVKPMLDNAKKGTSNIIAKTTSASTQAAVDTAMSAANQQKYADAGAKVSAAAVDSAVSRLDANKDTLNKMAGDAASVAAQSAIDTVAANNAQLDKIATNAGSSAAKGAIDTAAANKETIDAVASSAGAAATTGAIGALKVAASGAFSAALPWLIGAAVTTIGAMAWPKVKEVFKRMFRTTAKQKNSLAFIKFNDTDGNPWQFYFSKDKMLWKLDQTNSGEDANKNFTIAFMKTQFAQQFMVRCQQYIRNILDNQLYVDAIMKMAEKDPTERKQFENIVASKAKIYANMFTRKC